MENLYDLESELYQAVSRRVKNADSLTGIANARNDRRVDEAKKDAKASAGAKRSSSLAILAVAAAVAVVFYKLILGI